MFSKPDSGDRVIYSETEVIKKFFIKHL